MLFKRVENENIFPNIFIKKKETLNIVNLKKKKLDNYFYRNEDTNYLMSGTNYHNPPVTLL